MTPDRVMILLPNGLLKELQEHQDQRTSPCPGTHTTYPPADRHQAERLSPSNGDNKVIWSHDHDLTGQQLRRVGCRWLKVHLLVQLFSVILAVREQKGKLRSKCQTPRERLRFRLHLVTGSSFDVHFSLLTDFLIYCF